MVSFTCIRAWHAAGTRCLLREKDRAVRGGGDTNSANPPPSIPSTYAAWSKHVPELRTSTESEQDLVSQKSPEAMLTIPQPSDTESCRALWKATASVKFRKSLASPPPTSEIRQAEITARTVCYSARQKAPGQDGRCKGELKATR